MREWLNAQAAGGYVDYDADERPLRAAARAGRGARRRGQPGVPPGLFQLALGAVIDSPRDRRGDSAAATASAGTSTTHDVHDGSERFFRPGYNANLVGTWLPALDGVVAKLERGARVADVGCGHGASTILMAQAFPESTFVGSDYHEASIATARASAPRMPASPTA